MTATVPALSEAKLRAEATQRRAAAPERSV